MLETIEIYIFPSVEVPATVVAQNSDASSRSASENYDGEGVKCPHKHAPTQCCHRQYKWRLLSALLIFTWPTCPFVSWLDRSDKNEIWKFWWWNFSEVLTVERSEWLTDTRTREILLICDRESFFLMSRYKLFIGDFCSIPKRFHQTFGINNGSRVKFNLSFMNKQSVDD